MVKQRLHILLQSKLMLALLILLFTETAWSTAEVVFTFVQMNSPYINDYILQNYAARVIVYTIKALLTAVLSVPAMGIFRQAKKDNGDIQKTLRNMKTVSLIFAVLCFGSGLAYAVYSFPIRFEFDAVLLYGIPFTVFLELFSVSLSASSLSKTLSTGENVSTGLVLLQVSSMTAFLLKLTMAGLMFLVGIYGASMSDTRGLLVTQLFGTFAFNMAVNMILFFLAKRCYEIIHNDKKFDRIISKLNHA